jgi:uncharacterized protein involved in response to NO
VPALEDVPAEHRPSVVLTFGFRPFFLAAGCAAIALIALWIAHYACIISLPTYYGAIQWHAHEMLFGYTVAVIAGFLLTAVRNWTSLDTLRGPPLAALVALWIAGRLGAFAPRSVPGWLVASVDLAFLPALATSLASPLLRRRQWRNLPFVPILLVLGSANAAVHLDALGIVPGAGIPGLYAGADVIVLLIVVIGGRLIPFFTQRALAGARPRTWQAVEWLSLGSAAALVIATALRAAPVAMETIGALGALAHAVRLWGWWDRRIGSLPLLWILHAGYAWVVVGFALQALAGADVLRPQLAVHAFTAGAIGALTLGMMARVSLGHTGRPLRPHPAVVAAFVLVNAAALLRVFAGWWLPPEWYVRVIVASGLAWLAAFAAFLAVYVPILTRPRADLASPE